MKCLNLVDSIRKDMQRTELSIARTKQMLHIDALALPQIPASPGASWSTVKTDVSSRSVRNDGPASSKSWSLPYSSKMNFKWWIKWMNVRAHLYCVVQTWVCAHATQWRWIGSKRRHHQGAILIDTTIFMKKIFESVQYVQYVPVQLDRVWEFLPYIYIIIIYLTYCMYCRAYKTHAKTTTGRLRPPECGTG